METKLYNYLSKSLLEKDIYFGNIEIQKKIEDLKQNTLGLEEKYIKKIISYLKTYNKFLLSQGKSEVRLRYYQILTLYFAEMYFDIKDEKEMDSFSKNSLAYWMATGSGKTIVMHLNILQYLDKIKNYNKFQIIFTTPGVNLIDQHKEELNPFIDFLNSKYNNKINLIIDTTSSLLNKGSEYYSLAGNKRAKRLILIDEAHIGTSSKEEGVFYKFRNELNKENSFLFEYSATFHNLSKGLEKEYENQIIYDYNYNLFYKDGYGKDFSFKQVGNDVLVGDNENELKQNLDKCLLVINEKIDIWSNLRGYTGDKQKSLFGDFNMFPDKPLITFMGNTVNNKNKKDKDPEISDISNIVYYLANLSENEKKNFENVFNYKISGKLTITRNKSVIDELLLSYGDDGKYFGIINVGNGDKFFNDLDLPNIEKKKIEIIDSKYLFKNIDKKDSPINLLIGSRKFAEGWNSFRVSVIALINLGSNAGNKIIQIFGRGVRLKGLKDDGKRKYTQHEKDYFELGNNNEDKLKKIETLNILSVKKSYLETFTKKVNEEIKYTHSFKIKVNPNLIKLNSGDDIEFEEYKNHLPIFKLSKKEINYKNIILEGNDIYYSYLDENTIIEDEKISNFNFSLDFRIDKTKPGLCIKNNLKTKIEAFKSYINIYKINQIIKDNLGEYKINLYIKFGNNLIDFDYKSIFDFIDEIKYDNKLGNNLGKIEKTIIIVIDEFLKKLKNKVNHRINSKNIVYNKVLSQKTETNPTGDFIEEYIITKEFESENEKLEYIENIETEKQKIIDILYKNFDKHIYSPLLKEDDNHSNLGINISPDKLNFGEKLFIENIKDYINENYRNNKKLDFYLLRNVESLRSIGIYLENDEHPFFPDFILWIIDNKENKTYINFIDPKGQDGIFDRNSGNFNDKAKIGNKLIDNTLKNIEENLSKQKDKDIVLNSFIILKSGSDLGTRNTDNIQNKMLENNIYKIDWIGEDKLNGKSYLDLIFEKIL
ncbi:DEAD/DEAH box helicase family protein [Candidatus Vampirococcus lugosii]|uniref:Type III restriction-modification system DNA endonuclease res n=1 Tax=Candidatus Vampirococcus lugosii TaxID=2789015 RepID=A0ABS5QMF9_9BACT|nr:DEAD/DEAH box helicase family protein [Candidatus Vampirococcus lugosii]MBS8121881.1 Type III restriction-modification system DNA endonuclease res [Candidatus Vampirococcus lugosii]